MYDDYDDGTISVDHAPISDTEQRELDDIAGIEKENDVDESFEEDAVPELIVDPDDIPSSPEHPLYDSEGNLIPYGMSRKEWEKRKKRRTTHDNSEIRENNVHQRFTEVLNRRSEDWHTPFTATSDSVSESFRHHNKAGDGSGNIVGEGVIHVAGSVAVSGSASVARLTEGFASRKPCAMTRMTQSAESIADAIGSTAGHFLSYKNTGKNAAITENAVVKISRESEIPVKKHVTDLDGIAASSKDIEAALIHAARTASGIDESDAMHAYNKIRQVQDDFDLLFGHKAWRMAASLESFSNSVMADAMSKYARSAKHLSEEDFAMPSLKGLKGDERRQAKTLLNKKTAQLDRKLSALGYTKTEKSMLMKRSSRENIKKGYAARTALLDLNKKNPGMLTKEQLKYIRSDAFFDLSQKRLPDNLKTLFPKAGETELKKIRKDVDNIMAKGFAHSGSELLAKVASKRIDSLTTTRGLLKKENTKSFTPAQKALVEFQRMKVAGNIGFKRQKKDSTKGTISPLKISAHFLIRLDSDGTRAMNRFAGYVRTTGKLSSLVVVTLDKVTIRLDIDTHIKNKLGSIKTKVRRTKVASLAAKPVNKAKAGLKTVKRKATESKFGRGVKTANTTFQKYRPKTFVNKGKKAAATAIKKTWLGGILAKAGDLIAKILSFLSAVGIYILVGLLIFLCVIFLLAVIASGFTAIGQMIQHTQESVITVKVNYVRSWVDELLEKDDAKYEKTLERTKRAPSGEAWDGSKIYHYGHYEDNNGYMNQYRGSTLKQTQTRPSYYSDPDGQLYSGQKDNGAHIYYIDKDGNMIGSNTSNIKDVLSISTAYVNNWMDSTTRIPESVIKQINSELYAVLNPEPVYVESELYACEEGCNTYPKRGDYLYSITRAYECSDSSIYTGYVDLVSQGVKFYPNDSFTINTYDNDGNSVTKTFPERLVPQTEQGCNVNASLDYSNIIQAYRPVEYWRDEDTGGYLRDEDGARIVKHGAEKGILGVNYDYFCNGYTINYARDYAASFGDVGRYVSRGNAYGKSSQYNTSSYYDAEKSWQYAGFSTSRLYEKQSQAKSTPHAAIKACYGHRDLNIYITVLTKDDLIAADNGSIEYRVPKAFDAKTGLITQWDVKKTKSMNDYLKYNRTLYRAAYYFFKMDGFHNKDNYFVDMVEDLYDQDWFELYGVNVYGEAAIPDTLTKAGQTRLKMEDLEDLSAFRRNFVSQAYSYVSRIDYYYGGKATSLDYAANRFGTRVSPDSKGRTKKGLDCSGFVQFVYCQVTNTPLSSVGSTTRTFCSSLGLSRIHYDQLKPGDIGLMNLPGSNSNHIGIYAGNGMWIHCTGQPTNTVVYKNTNCFRYYYGF